jgi:hypothetical protein
MLWGMLLSNTAFGITILLGLQWGSNLHDVLQLTSAAEIHGTLCSGSPVPQFLALAAIVHGELKWRGGLGSGLRASLQGSRFTPD